MSLLKSEVLLGTILQLLQQTTGSSRRTCTKQMTEPYCYFYGVHGKEVFTKQTSLLHTKKGGLQYLFMCSLT